MHHPGGREVNLGERTLLHGIAHFGEAESGPCFPSHFIGFNTDPQKTPRLQEYCEVNASGKNILFWSAIATEMNLEWGYLKRFIRLLLRYPASG
jgi:hypothetical protein